MQVADVLARRRIDPRVVVEGPVAVPDHRFGDHDPRVGVAEDAGVLLVARRVGRDLAQVQVVAASRPAAAARCHAASPGARAPQSSACRARPSSRPMPGHHAHALRLDEDLALLALARPDLVAQSRRRRAGTTRRPSRAARRFRPWCVPRDRYSSASASPWRWQAMAAISCAASTNSPAMKTDSATLPSLLAVVWNDSPGSSEKRVEVQAVVPVGAADQRQPVRPQPVERVLDAALQVLVERLLGAGLVVVGHRLVQDAPVARLFEVGRHRQHQPQRVVVEVAARRASLPRLVSGWYW